MEQIGIALQKYHDQHGSFPPAYTVDADGNPLHSWRTLILPYFGEPKWNEIYDQIRFNEPWDSEHNRQFNEYTQRDTLTYATEREHQNYPPPDDYEGPGTTYRNMPSVYYCPGCQGGKEDKVKTVHKMIVGDNAIGNGHGTSKSQITRPLGETILVVEAGLPVPWMSPSDFMIEDFKIAIYTNEAYKIRMAAVRSPEEGAYSSMRRELDKRPIICVHAWELNILFADGTVKKYIQGKLLISEIEAMSRVRE